MKYDKGRKNPSQLLSLIDFTLIEFDAFLPTFKYYRDEYYSHFTLKGKLRERISYNRKSSLLSLSEEKLLLILSYMKNNPVQDYHAGAFGLIQPECNVWIHRLSDILSNTLKTFEELPDRNHLRVKYLLNQCNDVLLDGTERPIERS